MTQSMAQRIGTVLRQTVTLSGGHTAFSSTLGPLDAGPDPARRAATGTPS
jgi:hypothetical protein